MIIYTFRLFKLISTNRDTMKRIVFLLLTMWAWSIEVNAQNEGFDAETYNGKVQLTNGEALSGIVTFEVPTGRVIVNNAEGIQTFNARSVSSFEYYDYDKNTHRKFYSLLFNNNPTFFELLKEANNLALLSKENISSSQAVAYLSNKGSINNSLTDEKSSETLYFADEKGNIMPYAVVVQSKLGITSNYLSPYLLSTLTRGKYPAIRKYARDKRYSFKDKEDLIEILEYYEEIK